jgi:hypothetical protein
MEYLEKNRKELIETAIFSIGPLLALISARNGLKSWLRFEIVSAFVLATVLIISPSSIYSYIVSFLNLII